MGVERESAIVVELPELDAVVDEHRVTLDPSRRWGMRAHLTVLYPFVCPANVDGDTRVRVREAVAGVLPFAAEFGGFGWFADHVAWLKPSNPQPFTNLIERVSSAFPECPPYGGAFDGVVPHVTIGEGKPVGLLRVAMEAIYPHLPLNANVTSLSLMEGSTEPGSWRVLHRIDLGGSTGEPGGFLT